MLNRKQNVMKMAHQLFVEKGFQATSIQDILDYSGISKGTFYNYFSSKNELLIGIYRSVYKQLEKDRNQLLNGQDPSNIEIFIKQIEMQLITNRKNKLIAIYEEVMASNEPELKQFVRQSRLKALRWTYGRILDLFGEEKKPYLLDCAIMFQGILHHNVQYNRLAYETGEKISPVVRYSVRRLIKMVEEVSQTGEQLLDPELLETWIPTIKKTDHGFENQLINLSALFKKAVLKTGNDKDKQEKNLKLLEFILEELLQASNPRQFLIESALESLEGNQSLRKELQPLKQLVEDYFKN